MHPLQRQLKDLLVNNIGETLQLLLQIFSNNAEGYNGVIALKVRHERLQKDAREGVLNASEENLEFSRISRSVLGLIDLITPEEAAGFELQQSIFKRILVVCKSPDREQAMRNLFPETYFKGVEFDASGVKADPATVDPFDLIIFDNTPHGDKDDPQELLKHYLDNTKPLVLYFGQPLSLLYAYPEKAYFANSVFSIHARLEEMIQYVKYTGNESSPSSTP